MHWTGRLLFLCLGGLFIWLGFVRDVPESRMPMEQAVNWLMFGLFAFWAFWSAFFAPRISAALGPEVELGQPPASNVESAVASSWMVMRRVLLYPLAVFFALGGGYLLLRPGWSSGTIVASAIFFYAAYRAFTAAKYGQGYRQLLSEARQVDAERRRRYHWSKGDDVA
jgi:hypothetical protein